MSLLHFQFSIFNFSFRRLPDLQQRINHVGVRNLGLRRELHLDTIRAVFLKRIARIAAVNKLLTTTAADGNWAFQMHPRCRWLRDGFLFGYKFERAKGEPLRSLLVVDQV